ncbi:MAG: Holliday junction branch migration protein RuvA [Chloroflexota bacterium]
MIRLLRGIIRAVQKDHLIVEVAAAGGSSGIGLKLFVPSTTLVSVRTDDTALFHTYLQVREDALTLYGFESEDELEMFELLLGVNGVGPKVALATLSTLAPDALRLALSSGEPAVIARVPGIGKRTAEKIILELKDKVEQPTSQLEALAQATDADTEVIEALIALGYSVVEAQRAVQGLPRDVTGIEERLRLALSQFGG